MATISAQALGEDKDVLDNKESLHPKGEGGNKTWEQPQERLFKEKFSLLVLLGCSGSSSILKENTAKIINKKIQNLSPNVNVENDIKGR